MSNKNFRKNMTDSFNHVMCRGNNKQDIFFMEKDYLQCFSILESIVEQYECEIHSFCLMTNHMHFLIRTTHIPLKRVMQTLLSSYARYLNKAYERVGHLFQGRYVSKPVQTKPYFLELLYYIHNNPTVCIKNLLDYPWSSHNYFASNKPLNWLTKDYLMSLVQERFSCYNDFFSTYTDRTKIPEFCELDSMNLLSLDQPKPKNNNSALKSLCYFSFKEICQIICDVFNIRLESLSSISQARQLSQARAIAAYYSHFYGNFSLKFISIQFERHPKSLSRTMYSIMKGKEQNCIFERVESTFIKAIEMKKL